MTRGVHATMVSMEIPVRRKCALVTGRTYTWPRTLREEGMRACALDMETVIAILVLALHVMKGGIMDPRKHVSSSTALHHRTVQ